MNQILKLALNQTSTIVIESEVSLNKILCCDFININLVSEQSYLLCYGSTHELSDMGRLLEQAINSQLQLHSSINSNLGFMWNEYLHDAPDEPQPKFCIENDFWIGLRYHWLGSPGGISPVISTWLYNNQHGDIIMEVTPSYRWHFDDPGPGEEYSTYKQFMKAYQPLLLQIIPKEIATIWLQQIRVVEKQIKQNVKLASI